MTSRLWPCAAIAITLAAGLSGCSTTEQSRTLETAKPASASSVYQGPRSPISVGKFDNRSSFQRGIFSDGVDRLGGQARTILVTHLQQSGRSEEHTSELQSHLNLVCRLLLEKKKKTLTAKT